MFLFIMYQKLEVTQALRNTAAEQQTLNPAERNKLTKCALMLLITEPQHIHLKSGKISWHLNKYSQTY